MISEIKGAIFDLDGTLIDSMGIWEKVDIGFLKNHHLPIEEDYLQEMKVRNYHQGAVYTIERYHLKDSIEDLMKEWDALAIYEYEHSIPLKPGAGDLIRFFHEKGVRIALATASGPKLYNAVLNAHGLRRYFDAFVDSAFTVRSKDSPEIYLKAASLLDLDPGDCMVFEDILVGLKTAKAAGFRTCGVYDLSSHKDQEAIRNTSDHYFHDLSGFLDMIRSHKTESEF